MRQFQPCSFNAINTGSLPLLKLSTTSICHLNSDGMTVYSRQVIKIPNLMFGTELF